MLSKYDLLQVINVVKKWMLLVSTIVAFTKGQLYSKCLFGVRKQFDLRYNRSKVIFFVHFLGELKIHNKETFRN